MCTAATYKTNDFYFGRTLDYESSYGEEIVIMPRNFPLNFVNMGRIATHYAVIGTAHVAQDYPLFYDAANEKGLAMAGLNFVVTGSVERFANRNEVKDYIEKRGGKVTGSVTSKTNYLINNDLLSNSSKNKKA